ncbi:cytochrome-c oxidase, cbb3-type subunit III [Thalassobacter stenotrophicus]|uniref:Cbb3-type cytochrome c oxidase subunit n=2 Tax=Thalassobacter stenotrophicus TaxID=266809 RepID=A0A0N7LSV2_9RHOB|nr:cytochrome-c oxidase, cbb3-type subunit III [Thalassobacter stenotrophicus]PVZ50002.1 cytochrome-c oxidase, cbb3-type subunit III [Thalassobacter stenotrophicus]CUH58930.1 Cytochrome c oxidase subunit III [Thalassobacter stenotrophicus]SHJ26988.1 cytochrome c oxidase cbb3-type subunit 3 [Thalassobacter stenotrophicus DSM 16310]
MSHQTEDKEQELQAGDPNTTGHSWDGIKEFDNPMPRWWLWTFYACIVWAIGYTIAYPAWPMLKEATPGLLGYSTRAEVQQDIDAVETQNAPLWEQIEQVELASLKDNTDLHGFAVNGGAAIFKTWCAQCHGSGAAGAVGYPNLLDDDWLWGGTVDDIAQTVAYGIRLEDVADSRFSEMPAFGEILAEEEIAQVVSYVRSLSDAPHNSALASAGEVIFLDNCSSCHAEDGTGDRFQGAPNLTDAIWLFGGSEEAITETVMNSRYGVMPNWNKRLSEGEIRAVAAYVHQLGGGE